MTYDTKFTDDQMKIIDEVGDRVERAFDEARAQIKTARISDGDGGTHCLLCDCPGYVFAGGHALAKCDRYSCRHPFTRHDVW